MSTSIDGVEQVSSSGGGGGGAVTVADGADIAQGNTSDGAWSGSGSGTVVGILKKIASSGGSAVSIADGSDIAEGSTTDIAVVTDANGTVSAKLRGLIKIFANVWDNVNGRLNVSVLNSPVISGSVSVTNFPATQPVSVASLPLPSGAATSANQSTEITSLASIDSKLTNPLPVETTIGSLIGVGPQVTGTLDLTVLNSAVTITGLAGYSALGVYLVLSAVGSPPTNFFIEVTVDGSVWLVTPFTYVASTDADVSFINGVLGKTTQASSGLAGTSKLLLNVPLVPGVTGFRLRVNSTNSSGSIAVTLTPQLSSPFTNYVTLPGNSINVGQTNNSNAAATWFTRLVDSLTTTVATIKAASTASLATDTSLVVAVSPNSPLPAGANVLGHVINDSGSTTAVTSLPANASVNLTQINGVAVSVGQGISDTGTFRVSLAQEATYSAGLTLKTATVSGTAPFFSLQGSATKIIRLQRIIITGTWATAGYGDIIIKKTSTATSGGTATTLANVPFDSNDAAATAIAKYYTVLPTAGTLVGVILSKTAFFPLTGTPGLFMTQLEFTWRDTDAESPTLHGTAQCFEISFGTAPGSVPTLTISAAWTEK